MFRQQIPDGTHGIQNRFCKFSLLHQLAHRGTDFQPETIAALLVHRRITYDSELMTCGRDENQYPVAMPRLVHAKPRELPGSLGERPVDLVVRNEDPDFTGAFPF